MVVARIIITDRANVVLKQMGVFLHSNDGNSNPDNCHIHHDNKRIKH